VGWTNTMQGIFMMALAWGLGLWLPHELYGGVGPMFDALAEARPELLRAPGLGPDGEPWSWGGYTSAVAISVLGFSLWPHYFQKLFTARDVRTIKRTVVFYPTFLIFLVPILFIGFSGVLAFPGVEPADAILPTVITSLEVPAALVGLFCAGALAASMSTGDAILHAGASILVRDLWEPLVEEGPGPERERRSIQLLVVALGGLAYYLAILSDASLVALLLLSYGFIAQLFPLLLAAFFWPRATPAGALAGLGAGGAVTVLFNLVPALSWADVHPGIWGLAANVAALVAVSLATEPMEEDHVREFVVR
jgi:SSS family solute:Na+ symporter